jgi:NAD(P)-dependent dehydrogenase (short-subunit alcohol dehydrogenase family)
VSGREDMLDRVCLVTGGSRGIGFGIASELLERGARVVICSRREANLEAAAAALRDSHPHDTIGTCVANVGSLEDAQRAVDYAVGSFGRLDLLVNNAATNPHFGPISAITASQMAKTVQVNLSGVAGWSGIAYTAWMKAKGGCIVNVSSIGAYGIEPNIGFYNATKAAVVHLTRQLAFEMAPGVRVNGVAPGPVLTELSAAIVGVGKERIAKLLPLERVGQPSDIAAAVGFLASDAADWITGQTLVVDGGASVLPSGI